VRGVRIIENLVYLHTHYVSQWIAQKIVTWVAWLPPDYRPRGLNSKHCKNRFVYSLWLRQYVEPLLGLRFQLFVCLSVCACVQNVINAICTRNFTKINKRSTLMLSGTQINASILWSKCQSSRSRWGHIFWDCTIWPTQYPEYCWKQFH